MSEQPTFTPGPWELWVEEDDCGENYSLAMGSAIDSPGNCDCAHLIELYDGVSEEYGEQRAEIRANANLIAAAPDLYAALRVCVETHAMLTEGFGKSDPPAIRQAKSALAKAEGRPE